MFVLKYLNAIHKKPNHRNQSARNLILLLVKSKQNMACIYILEWSQLFVLRRSFKTSCNETSLPKKFIFTLSSGEHFVERHRVELIKRVSNIKPILDELLRQKIISRYSYDQMKPLPTSQEKMAELFRWPLPVSGGEGNKMFYKLLNEHEPHLIHELRRTEEPVSKSLMIWSLLRCGSHRLTGQFMWLNR